MCVYFSQLQENLLQSISSLVQSSDSDFWRNGRFLVHAGRHLASYKDGGYKLEVVAFSFSYLELFDTAFLHFLWFCCSDNIELVHEKELMVIWMAH